MYDKIVDLTKQVPNLPKGVSYVFYDYENGTKFSPEFTTNETKSIGYFDQAEKKVHQYNAKTAGSAKLLVAPSYGELKKANWDWGLAAKHIDAIDIQFGGYTKYPSLFLYAPQVVAQIRQESPNTPVFIQLSLLPRKSTPQITANDIYTLDGKGVNNFLPYYNQTSSVQSTTLQQFFSLLPRSVPQSPTNLTTSAVSSSQINLSWSAPANSNYSAITGYKVERVTGDSTTWENVTSNTNSNATLYSDTKLEHDTTYTYRVSAINQMGTSYQSNTTFATTFNTVPQPPTNLSATAISSSQINLSWTAPSNNGGSAITGYKIERSTDGGSTWSISNTASTTYSDTGLVHSTTYTYRVSAINQVGSSQPSNTVSATTFNTVPTPPAGLKATAQLLQIDLSWNAPSDDGGTPVTGYMIERSTDNGNTWSVTVASTGNAGTTYSDTSVLPLTTYTYRVSAINDVGTSDPSNTASATTPTVGPVTPPSLP